MEPPVTSSQRGSSDAALRSAEAIVSGVVIDIAGLPVLLRAADDARADAVARLLGEAPEGAGPPAVSVVFGRGAVPLPDRTPDESYGALDLWRTGSSLLISHVAGVQAVAADDELRVGGEGDLVAGFHALFVPGLAHLFAARDLFVVHAGAIVREGGAVLGLGATGAGKSSLAAAALSAGWGLLSDDLVVLRAAGDIVEVAGVPKPAFIPADIGELHIRGLEPGIDHRGRRRMGAHHLRRGWFPTRGAVVVEHDLGGSGRLDPLSPEVFLANLLGAFPAAADVPTLRRFVPIAANIARMPTWELRHSTDPSSRAEHAARRLEQAFSLAVD